MVEVGATCWMVLVCFFHLLFRGRFGAARASMRNQQWCIEAKWIRSSTRWQRIVAVWSVPTNLVRLGMVPSIISRLERPRLSVAMLKTVSRVLSSKFSGVMVQFLNRLFDRMDVWIFVVMVPDVMVSPMYLLYRTVTGARGCSNFCFLFSPSFHTFLICFALSELSLNVRSSFSFTGVLPHFSQQSRNISVPKQKRKRQDRSRVRY